MSEQCLEVVDFLEEVQEYFPYIDDNEIITDKEDPDYIDWDEYYD